MDELETESETTNKEIFFYFIEIWLENLKTGIWRVFAEKIFAKVIENIPKHAEKHWKVG